MFLNHSIKIFTVLFVLLCTTPFVYAQTAPPQSNMNEGAVGMMPNPAIGGADMGAGMMPSPQQMPDATGQPMLGPNGEPMGANAGMPSPDGSAGMAGAGKRSVGGQEFDPAGSKLNVESIPVELRILKKVEEEVRAKFKNNVDAPANISSMIYTSKQLSLLNAARQGFNNALSEEDLASLSQDKTTEGEEATTSKQPSVQYLSLGGIVFDSKNNWTIWLNGARTTKETLPKEVLDIQVTGEYVELKWFDEATNQIFPVRLRPNQKFDLGKKVFLPASAG